MKRATSRPKAASPASSTSQRRHIAVIGAGMAGVTCARTLLQAGHRVTLFEKSRGLGGRMSTRRSDFGGFDHGAQYFTVRDPRFQLAIDTVPGVVLPWNVNTVRVLDKLGQTLAATPAAKETQWVSAPGMSELVKAWGHPMEQHPRATVKLQTLVLKVERDALSKPQWQLQTEGPQGERQVHGGFDTVVLATPHPQASQLLRQSGLFTQAQEALNQVHVAPCWTLMLAFPQASQPNLPQFGPRWHAARSDHHRIRWVARENSKPGRSTVERWTVQASPDWSQEHLEDDAERVKAKMIKGFAEVTGIRAEPSHADVHRWRYAQTPHPLGEKFLWDGRLGIGLCGDWCMGHRVEDAFLSGLELALHIA